MARANKYASVNFNHVYDKNISNSSSSSNTNNNPSKHPSSTSFYSTISSPNSPNNIYKSNLPSSSTRTHGRMLVLTRPTPKPISTIQTTPLTPSPKTPPIHPAQVQIPVQTGAEPEQDSISLRPLGRTGVGSIVSSPVRGQEKQKEVGASLGSPKPDKFVPPHLRSGFVGREERPGPEVFRGKETQIQWKSAQFKWMSSDDTEVITCTRTGSLMPHTRYFIEPQFSSTVPLELSLSLSRGSVAF
uniref:Proteophosphoglycan-related family protein n=1 Tax=Populus alba TaxID=43335 RepID=A0A4U5LQG4_POPAL|nr:proteophosphoglycan-related family protein [Populus alba]